MNYIGTKEIILLSLIMTLISAILVPFLSFAVIAVLILIFLLYLNTDYYPQILLIALLVITSDISEGLRLIVNSAGIFFFFYLFIKKYGLDFKYYPSPPVKLFLFCLLVMISMVGSSIAGEYTSAGFSEILRQFIFFILVYFFFSFTSSFKDVDNYLTAFVLIGVLLSISVIYIFFSSDASLNLLLTRGLLHEGGYFKNVTAVGGILAVTICLTISLYFAEADKSIKAFLFAGFVIQVAGLFLTNSRASVLSVIISLSYILIKLKKINRKIVLGALSSALILFIFFFNQIISWVSVYFRVGRIFENTRFYLWDISFNIIKDYPIFGVGPGAFKYYMYKYLPVHLGSWDEQQLAYIYDVAGLGHQHNFLLFRATELGILGILTTLLLPVMFFYYSYKTLKSVKRNISINNFGENGKYFPVIIGCIGIGYGLFVRSIYESTGLLSHGWITRDLPFWIIFVIIIFLYKNLKSGPNLGVSTDKP